MKKLSLILLSLSLLAGGSLYASGNHGHENESTSTNNHMSDKKMNKKSDNNHMGNHMHEGKMTNHMNMDGKTDEQMKNMNKKSDNNHMGNHMHEGKMTNHMNMDGMTDEQMNMKKSK